MKALKVMLSVGLVMLVGCSTRASQGATSFPGTTTPGETPTPELTSTPAPSATPSPVVPTPLPPDAYDPQKWADFVLLQDYWPAIKEKVGDAAGSPWTSVYELAYSSAGGYVAVSGCERAKLEVTDLFWDRTVYPCDDDDGGLSKAVNGYAFILAARTGEIIATLPPTGTKATVSSLAFSHDGKSLAYGVSTGSQVIWDIASGSIEKEITEPAPESAWWPHSGAFSPDDRLLALNYGIFTKIWDRTTKDYVTNIVEPPWPYLTFSPDGKKLLAEGGLPDAVYDTTTWEKLASYSLKDAPYPLSVGGINPEFTLYSFQEYHPFKDSMDDPVLVYDFKTGSLLQTLKGSWHGPRMIDYTPDGRYMLRLDRTGRGLAYWRVEGWEFLDGGAIMDKMVKPVDQPVVRWRWSEDGKSIVLLTPTRIGLYGLP